MQANQMFSSRDNLQDAVTYAQTVISALPSESQLPALTAMWIVANTALRTGQDFASLQPHHMTRKERAELPPLKDTSPALAMQIVRNDLGALCNAARVLRDENHALAPLVGQIVMYLSIGAGLTPETAAKEAKEFMDRGLEELLSDPKAIVDLLQSLRS